MTTTADPTRATWDGTAVDVAGIEKALGQLWQQVSRRDAADGHQLPVRARVMNLVVYVSCEDDAAALPDTIAVLANQHPSRTILVVADPNAPTSSFDATATVQCSTADPSSGRLCWEQVTITAHGATAAHVPGIVIPLLLPDLPTYLWWVGEAPFGTVLFRRMADLCDRLIVDSSRFTRSIDGLVKLAAVARDRGGERGVSDFHWMRLTPWRNLVAQFYDKEQCRPYAYRLEKVQLGYARREQNAPGAGGERGEDGMAQALLLAGWLAARLGWTPHPQAARLQGDALYLEAGRAEAPQADTVTIEIVPHPPASADAGDMVSLQMRATLRGVPAVFSIERRAEDSEAATTATIGDASGVAHTVRMATRGIDELLAEELAVFQHDRVYDAVLDMVARLCERVAAER